MGLFHPVIEARLDAIEKRLDALEAADTAKVTPSVEPPLEPADPVEPVEPQENA